jgi:hypothetical protein
MMRKLMLLAGLASVPLWAMPHRAMTPNIQLTKEGRVIAHAMAGHQPLEQRIEIVDSENCAVRKISDTEIQIADPCPYLGGIYHYLFDPRDGQRKHQMATGFSVSRQATNSRVLLVAQPLELLAP